MIPVCRDISLLRLTDKVGWVGHWYYNYHRRQILCINKLLQYWKHKATTQMPQKFLHSAIGTWTHNVLIVSLMQVRLLRDLQFSVQCVHFCLQLPHCGWCFCAVRWNLLLQQFQTDTNINMHTSRPTVTSCISTAPTVWWTFRQHHILYGKSWQLGQLSLASLRGRLIEYQLRLG